MRSWSTTGAGRRRSSTEVPCSASAKLLHGSETTRCANNRRIEPRPVAQMRIMLGKLAEQHRCDEVDPELRIAHQPQAEEGFKVAHDESARSWNVTPL
jgi:hypothetical protein